MEEPSMEEESVPSWAEFYQELLNELACPPDAKGEPPELVTLINFDEKATRTLCERSCIAQLVQWIIL